MKARRPKTGSSKSPPPSSRRHRRGFSFGLGIRVHQDVAGIGTARCGDHRFARRPADTSYGRSLQKPGPEEETMDIKKKLQNPFALVAQGFVAGAILFWTTAPAEADAPNQVQGIEAAATTAQSFDA
jgi:hypothetical protein